MFVDTKEAATVGAVSPLVDMLKQIRALIGDPNRHCRFVLAEAENNENKFAFAVMPHDKAAVKWCLMGAADKFANGKGIWRERVNAACTKTITLHPELMTPEVKEAMTRNLLLCSTPVMINNYAPHSVTMRMIDLTIERLLNEAERV